eukprot:scaffold107449_cov33-Phaeocystis_antarctica.AAC.1
MSRLEIGCAGCSLVARSGRALRELEALAWQGRLEHTFVALVHGRVPASWGEARAARRGVAEGEGGGGGEGGEGGEGDEGDEGGVVMELPPAALLAPDG